MANAAPPLPANFLPSFTSNGQVYASSEFLELEAICLNANGLASCEDFPRRVRAPPLPPYFFPGFRWKFGVSVRLSLGIHDLFAVIFSPAFEFSPLGVAAKFHAHRTLLDAVNAQVRNKLDAGLTKMDSLELKHLEVPMDEAQVRCVTNASRATAVPRAASAAPAGDHGTLAACIAVRPYCLCNR